jgi:hypothetical protein
MITDPLATDLQRRLVQNWQETGKVLAELRHRELAHQSAEDSRHAAYDMLQLGGILPPDAARERTSGLVEMQRLFAGLRLRDHG